MLRGIHKASSNWLGRAVMGVVLGLIAISFGIWGIGDIFRGFGTRRSPRSAAPRSASSSSASSTRTGCSSSAARWAARSLPDQARALGLDRQLLGEVIAETALDERARAAAAQRQRRRDRPPDHRRSGLQGHQRPVRPRAVRADAPQHRATPKPRFVAEQRQIALRQQIARHRQRRAAVPKTALEAFNRFQNEERDDRLCHARPGAGRRHRRADARGARQVFRGAQGRVPRAGIPQAHDCWCSRRPISPSRIEVPMPI